MRRLITLVCLFVIVMTTTLSAETVVNVKATPIHKTPTYRTTIRHVYQGDSKVTLKSDVLAVDGYVRFVAPADGRYVFVFSNIKTNIDSTLNRPAIFCFYDEYFNQKYVDGLSAKSNGFALAYDKNSARRTLYKKRLGVSLELETGEIINICCSNLLDNVKGSKASYKLSISLED